MAYRSKKNRSFKSSIKKGTSDVLGVLGSGFNLVSKAAKTGVREGKHILSMKRKSRKNRRSSTRRNRRR